MFALGPECAGQTVADDESGRHRHSWTIFQDRLTFDVSSAPTDAPLGTTVRVVLHQSDAILRAFAASQTERRSIVNGFASYLLRYHGDIAIEVDGEVLVTEEFIESSSIEDISGVPDERGAVLRHLVLSRSVDQDAPSILQFAANGATIVNIPIEGEPIPGDKYLGLVDSPYLMDLTNTAKSALATVDDGFRTLEQEVRSRALRFILDERSTRTRAFIEVARERPYYPFQESPKTILEDVSKQIYDGILVSLETGYGISSLGAKQQRLVFSLARHLLHSEDLADVLTSILGLTGDGVARFAELLRRTSLNSLIALSELLVDRISFLEELRELVYGKLASQILERRQLHKIIERHAWLFGEDHNLMGSDMSLAKLLPIIESAISEPDAESEIPVGAPLLDIPDLYFLGTKWHEGGKYFQHLVVELKRPSVKIGTREVAQLKRYAREIVELSMLSQAEQAHRFTFVLVSSDVSEAVRHGEYQAGKERGGGLIRLIGITLSCGHRLGQTLSNCAFRSYSSYERR